MEDYRARLGATDRPAPFRIENLGSWASLDDGDDSVSACHATLSGQTSRRKRRSVVESPNENLGSLAASRDGATPQVPAGPGDSQRAISFGAASGRVPP